MTTATKLDLLVNTKEQIRLALGLPSNLPFGEYYKHAYPSNDLTVFAGGKQGAWYDPSDLSTLFQDAAFTIPVTANGDPVGGMLDKSGNGNHATQTISASRPIYQTDAVLHWLQFDGVDDFMSTNAPLYANQNSGYTALAVNYTRPSLVVVVSSAISVAANSIKFNTTGSPTNTGVGWTSSGGNYIYGGYARTTSGASVVYSEIIWTTGVIKIRENGGVLGVSQIAPADTPMLSASVTHIGQQVNNTFRFKGNIYAVLIGDGVLDGSNLESAERYLATKSGVTL